MRLRRLRAPLACVLLYGALCAGLTWPLAARLSTHLPDTHGSCRFDTLFTGWLLAYESQRLTSEPLRLAEANIYAPARNALFYGPTALGALPFFAAIYLPTGDPTLALNLLFLGSIAASATALHLVVRRWTSSHAAGVVAAAALLSNRWLLWEFVPTAPIYGLLLWFPLIMLLAAEPARRWRDALALLPVVLAQELVHFGYIAPSVLGPLALLAGVRLLRPSTRAAGAKLGAVVGLAALALLPDVLAYGVVRRENPLLAEQTIWRGLAQPPTDLPWGINGYQMPTAVVPLVFLLIAVGGSSHLLSRSQASPLTRRGWTQAGFWVAAGTLLSLTPTVKLFGRQVALPQAWLVEWLPLLGRLRVPSRLSLGALIGLAALAGLAFAELARRVSRALERRGVSSRASKVVVELAAAAIVGLMFLQYARGYGSPAYLRRPLPREYPTQLAIDGRSPLLALVRQRRGPLLDLPVGPGGILPHWQTRAMYRSIFHWRDLVNGYDSYWPAGFPERMQLALALPDRASLAALQRATGLELVLVHVAELPEPERAAWLELAAAGGREDLELTGRDGDDLLFTVQPAAHLPVASPGDRGASP